MNNGNVNLTLMSHDELSQLIDAKLEPVYAVIKALKETTKTKAEIADELRVSYRTIEYWEAAGKITRINEVGEPRYRYSDVLTIKAGQKV
jgi:hypothetical protein